MDYYFMVFLIAIICYVAFQNGLRHHRRVLIHRERVAAVEKGIELPPVEREVERQSWNVQRILLLAGLTWIALGVSAFVLLSALIAGGSTKAEDIPNGLQWIGLAPVGIGVAHLIVYFVGRRQEK